MKEKPKLFIHIGTPKTGTSSIQSFLNDNHKILKDNGYYFQKYKRYDNSYLHSFRQYCQKLMIEHHNDIEAELYPFIKDTHYNDATKNIEYYEKKVIKKIQKNFLSKNKNIIISAESFFDYDTFRFKEIMKLLDRTLNQYKDKYNINIILYFRKQDSFIESFYYMCGKYMYFSTDFQSFLGQFKPFAKSENAISLNWPDFIEIINSTLPYAKVITRSFDSAVQKGIIQDFREITGIDQINCIENNIHENPGFNALGMDIMLHSDFLNNKDKEILFRAIRGDKLFTKSTGQKYNLFTHSQRIEIYNTYRNSNQKLFNFDDEEYIELFYPKNIQNSKDNPLIPEFYMEIFTKKIVALKKKTMEYRLIQIKRLTLNKMPPKIRSDINRIFMPLWSSIIKIYWKLGL